MGSPLGPTLANLFMGFHEKEWIKNYTKKGPSYYKRYVDDIFAVFNCKDEALQFFDYLNTRHPNITFSIECEINRTLPFLDVNISCNNDSLVTSVYHKTT